MGGDHGFGEHPIGHSNLYMSQSPNETKAYYTLVGRYTSIEGGGTVALSEAVTINK